MKYFYFVVIYLINLHSYSQTVYQTFTNGPWSSSSTWLGNNQPPSTLPFGDTIYVNHIIDFNNDVINEGVIIIDSNAFLDGSSSLNNIEVIDKGELINYGQVYVGRMTIETNSCLAANIYLPRANNYGLLTTEHDLTVGSNSGCGSLFNFPGGKVYVGVDGTGDLHLDYYLCNQDSIYIATRLYNHGGIVECCGYIETPLVDVKQFGGRPGTFNCIGICTDTIATAPDPTLEIDNSTYSSLNDAYVNAPSSQIQIDNDSVFFCGLDPNGNPPCNLVFLYDSNMYCNDTLNPIPFSLTQSFSQLSGYFTANGNGLVFADTATGEIDLQNSLAGQYSVYYNYNNCVDSFSLEIVDPSFFYANIDYCKNDIDPLPVITGSVGGVFSADNSLNINSVTGEIDIALSNDTNYTIINDLNGCRDTFQLEIIDASFTYSNTIYCNTDPSDSAIVLGNHLGVFTADTSLSINTNGVIDFTLSLNQLYSVIHTTPQGCVDTLDIEVVSAEISYLIPIYCKGSPNDSAIIMGNSGGSFSSNTAFFVNSSNGMIDFISTPFGQHTITYTEPNGCLNSWDIVLGSAEFNYNSSVYCMYSPIDSANILGDTSGLFDSDFTNNIFNNTQTGEINFSNLLDTSYWIYYEVFNTCIDSFQLEVESAEITYSNSIYCKGSPNDSAIILGASNGVFSSLSLNIHMDTLSGLINFDSTTVGNYVIIYETINQCRDTFEIQLASAHFNYSDTSYCGYSNNDTANILGNPVGIFTSDPLGLSFVDSLTGEIDFSNSLDTSYWVYYEVLSTCIDSFPLEVIDLLPNAGMDSSVCGFTYQLMGQPNSNTSYSWISFEGLDLSSDTIIDPQVTAINDGAYSFELTLTERQCVAVDTVVINFFDYVTVDPGPDQYIDQSTANLSATSNNGTIFYWENLSMLGTILEPDSMTTGLINLVSGDYLFGVTASNGVCPSVYEEVTYFVDWIFIPSGFSPNGDGINDLFLVEGARLNVDFEMQIVNRWGELVFATSDIFTGWDGTINSGWAPVDTYFYFIRVADFNYKGYIELKR